MIELITQPDKWTSSYDANLFQFKQWVSIGDFTISNPSGGTNLRITVSSLAIASLFSVGQVVKWTAFSIDRTSTVESISGTTIYLTTKPQGAITYTSVPVQLLSLKKMPATLYVARLPQGVAFTKLTDLYIIYRNGFYSVDVRGYLQDYFRDKQPPAIGIDAELYCNYKLVIEGNIQIGGVINSAYSCVKDINSTPYVTSGSPLRMGAIEVFNGNQTIYSRINGDAIETLLI